MEKLPLCLLIGSSLFVQASCSKHIDDHGSSDVDHQNPKRVVSSIFYAAQTGDTQHLASLCDPEGRSNLHALRVCSQDEKAADWPAFVKQFARGKLIGEARISEDTALVNFVFGEKGSEPETMQLIRHNKSWHLLAF